MFDLWIRLLAKVVSKAAWYKLDACWSVKVQWMCSSYSSWLLEHEQMLKNGCEKITYVYCL